MGGHPLHALFGGAEDEATRQQSQFDEQRAADLAMYQAELLRPPRDGETPEAYEARKQQIAGEISKLRNLKGKDTPYHQLGTFLGKLGRIHLEKQPAAGAGTPSGATVDATGGAAGGAGGGAPLQGETAGLPNTQQRSLPPLTSASGQPTPPQKVVPPGQPTSSTPPVMSDQTHKILNKIGRGLGSMMLATEPALLGKQPQTTADLPPLNTGVLTPATGGREQYGTFDIPGDSVIGQRNAVTGQPITADEVKQHATWRQVVRNGQVSYSPSTKAVTVSGIPRAFAPTSVSQAKTSGQQYMDEGGNPIDVQSLPDTMQLVPIRAGDKTFYLVTSQGQTHFTVGGKVYAMPKFEQMTPGQWVDLGPSKTPTASSTTDPFGMTTTHTSTPSTPGAPGAGPAAAPAAATPQAGASKPPSKARRALSPIIGTPALAAAAPAAARGQLDASGHIPEGSGNPLVVEAANQLLDGQDVSKIQPAKARDAAAALARQYGWEQGKFTPKEQVMLREATTFLQDGINNPALKALDEDWGERMMMSQAALTPDKEGYIGRGLTTAAAKNLSPREAEYIRWYNQMVGTISGLAQLVRSGRATEATIERLKAELPNPVNTQSSADARQRLQRLMKEVNVALEKGTFTGSGSSGGRGGGKSLPGKPGTPSTAEDYLKSIGHQ